MRIIEIQTEGVGGVADRTFDLRGAGDAPAPVVLVTGPSGAGKSSLLRAIAAAKEAVAAYGSLGWLREVIRSGLPRAVVRIEWQLDEDEVRYGGFPGAVTTSESQILRDAPPKAEADPGLVGLLGRYAHDRRVGRVDLLPPLRLPIATLGGWAGDPVMEQRMMRLTSDGEKLAGVQRVVRKDFAGGSPTEVGSRARELFARLCPGRELAGVTGDGELEVRLPGGARLRSRRLSTSEQQALALACHVAVTSPGRSVVLFDTPEASLPPGRAAEWIAILREEEASNQWIVATTDPELLRRHEGPVIEVGRT